MGLFILRTQLAKNQKRGALGEGSGLLGSLVVNGVPALHGHAVRQLPGSCRLVAAAAAAATQ